MPMSIEEQSGEDQPVLDTLIQMSADTFERSGLDPRTFMMVRIAALVAVDAPPLSYLMNLSVASGTGLTAEDVQGTLVAVAPVVGGPRVVSSAGNIGRALGIAIKISDNGDNPELDEMN
jgi:alkylhydroperoxidase/carboxymuconolactone decarboxylase family protein YurZ